MTAEVTADLAYALRTTHVAKLELYATFLNDPGKPFFDVVVVTAADAEQTATFRSNIEGLQAAGRIPGGQQTEYMVVPDPPGRKVGCGGSTLYVIRDLHERYGAAYLKKRVLLIHAGGYSKRLPNHSHCGKIFSLLPARAPGCAAAAITMLELKLATFCHVPAQMPPGRGGIFVTCSDDIVFYDHEACDFSKPGFIALGHPGSTTIGKDHGVFVLEHGGDNSVGGLQPCKKFIHKYSIERQIAEGAVVGKTASGEDEVFTDSSYYFSEEVTERLHRMFTDTLRGEVQAEVDAYGDFMQGIGSGATTDWMGNFGNTAKQDAEETTKVRFLREAFMKALEGVPLWCLCLPGSRFYHVGTIKEALHHFCRDAGFLTCLGVLESMAATPADVCKIEAIVAPAAALAGPTVIEFSRVPASARIGAGCIVSGVDLPDDADVPADTFVQTLPLDPSKLGLAGSTGFVTHILSIKDDIKAQKDDLVLFGTSVGAMVGTTGPVSIWTAKLYPVRPTAAESLQCALDIQAAVAGGKAPACWCGGEPLVSLAECVAAKALTAQARQRQGILDEIAKM